MTTSGKLTIEIDGDEAKAHAAYMALNKDQKALVVEIGKMGTAAEAAANKSIQAAKQESKERADSIRLAQQLVKSNETLTQAYDRQKQSLDLALSAGQITAEQHKQTLDLLGEKVRQNSTEFIKAKDAEKLAEAARLEAARLSAKEMDAIADAEIKDHNDRIKVAKDLVKASETINQSFNRQKAALDAARQAGAITFEEYSQGLKKLQKDSHQAAQKLYEIEQAADKGVGQTALRKVKDFATGFVGIASAVAVVREALMFYNAEKDKAMGTTEGLQEVRRTMRQLSKGDFDQMQAKADSLTQFGLTNVQAGQLVADARAMGFEGDEEVVAKAQPVISLQEATVLAGTFREFFKDENLNIEEAFNAALQGAESHPLGIKEMIPQLATAATGRIEGGESSDIIASVAEMAKVVGLSAGERVRNLGVELAVNEKTKGLNMIDAMRLVGSDPALREEITGGNNIMKATVSSYLNMIDEIAATDKKTEAAVRNSGTDKSIIRLASTEAVDPNTVAGRIEVARQQAIAEQAKAERLNENALAEKAYQVRAAQEKVTGEAIVDGKNVLERMQINTTSKALGMVGANGTIVENVAPLAPLTSPINTVLDPVGTFSDLTNSASNVGESIGKSIKSWLWGDQQQQQQQQQADELKKQTTYLGIIADKIGENNIQAV